MIPALPSVIVVAYSWPSPCLSFGTNDLVLAWFLLPAKAVCTFRWWRLVRELNLLGLSTLVCSSALRSRSSPIC